MVGFRPTALNTADICVNLEQVSLHCMGKGEFTPTISLLNLKVLIENDCLTSLPFFVFIKDNDFKQQKAIGNVVC